MQIRQDDLKGPEIAGLLAAHLQMMRASSPACSVHALDLEGLRKPEITFWTIWDDRTLAGCGALKTLSGDHGEIKSMHTALPYRGKGVAAALLNHIIGEASRRSYARLGLETGSQDAFAPARAFYAKHSFRPCPPFADYRPDPNSFFMTRELG